MNSLNRSHQEGFLRSGFVCIDNVFPLPCNVDCRQGLEGWLDRNHLR